MSWSFPGEEAIYRVIRGEKLLRQRLPNHVLVDDDPDLVDGDAWRLNVSGLVRRDLDLELADLTRSRGKVTAVLDCTGGWHSTQEWEGMPLKDVLQSAGVKSGAGSITVRSVTGYQRRFSLKEADEYLLATHVGGEVNLSWTRLPGAVGGPRKTRFRVGEVGGLHSCQRHWEMVAAAFSSYVSRGYTGTDDDPPPTVPRLRHLLCLSDRRLVLPHSRHQSECDFCGADQRNHQWGGTSNPAKRVFHPRQLRHAIWNQSTIPVLLAASNACRAGDYRRVRELEYDDSI